MLHTMKRGLFVASALAVAAALVSGSAMAARGHQTFAPRAAHGMMGGFGPFAQLGGMPGPGFGTGFGGPRMRGHGPGGPGMRGPGGPGGGILGTAVLKSSATFLGISLADLQA